MGKGRMTQLDVPAIVKELRAKIVGMRVANVYNLNNRTYQFKFTGGDSKKIYVIMESGARVHTTKYERDKDKMPNQFALKIRKHIRTKRLEDIQQLGSDRIIDFKFGSGAAAHHIILELFAAGNIILTDASYEIAAVLRLYDPNSKDRDADAANTEENKDAEPQGKIAVRSKYPMQYLSSTVSVSAEIFERVLRRAVDMELSLMALPEDAITQNLSSTSIIEKQDNEESSQSSSAIEVQNQKTPGKKQKGKQPKEQSLEKKSGKSNTGIQETEVEKANISGPPLISTSESGAAGKRKNIKATTLKQILSTDKEIHLGPIIVEHCLLKAGLSAHSTLKDLGWKPTEVAAGDQNLGEAKLSDMFDMTKIASLVVAFSQGAQIMNTLSNVPLPGYIVVRKNRPQPASVAPKEKLSKKELKQRAKQREVEKKAAEQKEQIAAEARLYGKPVPTFASEIAQTFEADGSHVSPDSAESPDHDAKPNATQQIVSQVPTAGQTGNSQKEVEEYVEFLPILLAQHDQKSPDSIYPVSRGFEIREFPSFDDCLDEFFSKTEQQKQEIKQLKEEAAAWHKVERVKQDHQIRISRLEASKEENARKAQLLETNLNAAQAAMNAITTLLAQGMDWREIETTVNEQRRQGHPIARIIAPNGLKLQENTIVLLLSDRSEDVYESDSEEESFDDDVQTRSKNSPVRVDVNLSLSAYANAQMFYQTQKQEAKKKEKTVESSDKAIKQAEKRTTQALKQVEQKVKMQKIRKVHWFEKFHWFISSENFLVIGGKDAQQNELLVKRYLQKNDVYIHGDFHGASSVVIKNPHETPIPPKTLFQAGTMCVCRSSSWTEKIPNSAYWVYAHQVSKTAPTGEYLPTGSFMIRGKRNYLPHTPLTMAFGVMFRLDDSCLAKHVGERKVRAGLYDAPSDSGMDAPQGFMDIAPTEEVSAESVQIIVGKSSNSSLKAVPETSSLKPLSAASSDEESDVDVTSQFLKYGASVPVAASAAMNEVTEPEEAIDSNVGERKSKAKLSRKQRKALKKGTDEMSQDETQEKTTPEPIRPSAEKPTQSKPEVLPRGKRTKLKRIKKKYAEQDEEDKQLAAEIFGLKIDTPASDDDDGAGVKSSPAVFEDKLRICFFCKQHGHLYKNCPLRLEDSKVENAENAPEVTPNSQKDAAPKSLSRAKKEAKEAEEKEIQKILEEENIASLEPSEQEYMSELDTLTGKPLADDILRYAIPVCAPVGALADYKFKVKLLPGGGKKGKAARAAIDIFCHQSSCTAQEKELIKAIQETETARVFLSSSRIAAAAGNSKSKAKKKGSKGASSRESLKDVDVE